MMIVRKNELMTLAFHVCEYRNGVFIGSVAGMGRNKGTWNSNHSKRTAYRHAAVLRKENPKATYKVEPTLY